MNWMTSAKNRVGRWKRKAEKDASSRMMAWNKLPKISTMPVQRYPNPYNNSIESSDHGRKDSVGIESDKPQISRDGKSERTNYILQICFCQNLVAHSAHVAWSTKKKRTKTRLIFKFLQQRSTSDGHEELHLVSESCQPGGCSGGQRRSHDEASTVGMD